MAQTKEYPKPHQMLEEADVGIKVRDGVRLSARIYRPKGATDVPVLLAVSPYQHATDSLPHSTHFLWHEVGPVSWWVETQGYAIVHVDVRGTGQSEGDYGFLSPAEQQDLYDIIQWCAAQPWSNGNVGGYGQSYYSWSQWFMAIMNPPALKCIVPYDGSTDMYRDLVYHGGIYCDFAAWWFQMLRLNNRHRIVGQPSAKAVATAFWDDLIEHQTYDEYWKSRSVFERLDEIKVPTFSIGHWGKMGIHLRGNILSYENLKAPKKLLVTASDVFQAHALFDEIEFHEQVLLPFYDQFLKGKGSGALEGPPVRLYIRGAETFRDEAAWPLPDTNYTSFYLSGEKSGSVSSLNDGSLVKDAPSTVEGTTEFVYPNPKWKFGVVSVGPFGPDPAGGVLTYTTPPLEEDLEITGCPVLELHLSSSNVDTDVIVKISEQFAQSPEDRAAGKQPAFVQLSKGWLRASHREKDMARSTPQRPYYSHENPQPLTPHEVVKLEVEILPFSNRFRKGSRIRLELANGDSQMTDPFITHHYMWWKVGTDTLHHNAVHASRLILPVIKRS